MPIIRCWNSSMQPHMAIGWQNKKSSHGLAKTSPKIWPPNSISCIINFDACTCPKNSHVYIHLVRWSVSLSFLLDTTALYTIGCQYRKGAMHFYRSWSKIVILRKSNNIEKAPIHFYRRWSKIVILRKSDNIERHIHFYRRWFQNRDIT